MTTDRRFCRFNKHAKTMSLPGPSEQEVPEDGFCISAFLVITDAQNPNGVLMGHLNPEAPWDHLGAFDASRVDFHLGGSMLPSSHLMLFESPQAAAKRMLKEQLEIDDLSLQGPQVVSETYTPKKLPTLHNHWDLEFMFKGRLSKDQLRQTNAWSELAFVNVQTVKRSAIARSHGDLIESAGIALKGFVD